MTSASLCIDRAGGEQVVRPPRPTDAVGEALRGAFPAGSGLPDDMIDLLRKLNRSGRPH
ncbi:hypothetical protein Q5H91_00355 [Sphingomonas sp. KR1UV-12]|uniref:Anti-sigma factor NepR domain-containing protein n=1 Tax=Sphingomonas aurea TaxID=3063994 RepID=A0ABT9EFV3_9SPHN|nr:hypothetical protein [Sphingomonas sp. KR1UV-12]MDP1025651.1 hypothetical protein [Sphingomonas sp. KR1UV-12]